MKINNALYILDLHSKYNIYNISSLSNHELKKAYHIMALNRHPDKNPGENANAEFQDILNAYNCLNVIINSESKTDTADYTDINYSELIISFINLFIKNSSKNKDNGNNDDDIVDPEIKKFKTNCMDYFQNILEKLLDKLSLSVLEEVYNLLIKTGLTNNANTTNNTNNANNANNANTTNKTINIVIEIIKRKLQTYNVFILNPTLANILNSEIYKLEIQTLEKDLDKDIVYVPLWHSELNYETSIIKIEPILDKYSSIDEDNNLHYNYYNIFEEIVSKISVESPAYINIKIENIDLSIPIGELKFKRYQSYTFYNIGIPKMDISNILNNKTKADIIVHINLV